MNGCGCRGAKKMWIGREKQLCALTTSMSPHLSQHVAQHCMLHHFLPVLPFSLSLSIESIKNFLSYFYLCFSSFLLLLLLLLLLPLLSSASHLAHPVDCISTLHDTHHVLASEPIGGKTHASDLGAEDTSKGRDFPSHMLRRANTQPSLCNGWGPF